MSYFPALEWKKNISCYLQLLKAWSWYMTYGNIYVYKYITIQFLPNMRYPGKLTSCYDHNCGFENMKKNTVTDIGYLWCKRKADDLFSL